MYLIAYDAFQGKWSADIHNEWTLNLIASGKDKSKVMNVKKLMDDNFPDSIVTQYKALIKNLTLPDQDDRHVLAVAIKSGATYIITKNLKHFPKKFLPENIEALSPDDFLVILSKSKPHQVLSGVKAHRLSLKNPPYSTNAYVKARNDQGLKIFAKFLTINSLHL